MHLAPSTPARRTPTLRSPRNRMRDAGLDGAGSRGFSRSWLGTVVSSAVIASRHLVADERENKYVNEDPVPRQNTPRDRDLRILFLSAYGNDLRPWLSVWST